MTKCGRRGGPGRLGNALEILRRFQASTTSHLGLEEDAPVPYPVQACNAGPLISEPVLGGLHHRYFLNAA